MDPKNQHVAPTGPAHHTDQPAPAGMFRQRLRLLSEPDPAVFADAPNSEPEAVDIGQVLRNEAEEVDRLYRRRHPAVAPAAVSDRAADPPAHSAGSATHAAGSAAPAAGPVNPGVSGRFALSFSGGGIRSASVNLGLMQALARERLLGEAHYISGISGGGYILGWMTSWAARVGFREVQAQLGQNTATPHQPLPTVGSYHRYLEPNPIHYLRRYVSYLVPRSGFASGDTLAVIAIYLRNLLLMQTMCVAALIAVMALLQTISPALRPHLLTAGGSGDGFKILAAALAIFLGIAIWTALALLARNANPGWRRYWAPAACGIGFLLSVVLWVKAPAFLASHDLQSARLRTTLWALGVFGASELAATVAVVLITGSREMLKGVKPRESWWARLIAYAGTAVFIAVVVGVTWHSLHLGLKPHSWMLTVYRILALPCVLVLGALVSFLFIGLYGDALPDAKREWLGRLAGYYLFFAVVVAVTLASALLGPDCVHWLLGTHHPGWKGKFLEWVLPGGWVFTTLAGVLAGHSAATSGKDTRSPLLEGLAAAAPAVFLLGLMLCVSWATHHVALALRSSAPMAMACDVLHRRCGIAVEHSLTFSLLMLFIAAALLAVFLGWRLSVNEFSLHLFYRNRLVRTFLGASNVDAAGNSARKPDPFTGFTLDDDHFLGNLQDPQSPFDGPYPLWGTALNLTGGEDLAWQKRKAASFLYSPLYCGWDHPQSSAYRKVAQCKPDGTGNGNMYGGKGGAPLVGTAMAASGAAISPNWGFHTRPSTAALLALFNVRIGWWTGNPMDPKGCKKFAPGAYFFLLEMFGVANERRDYVYLSDGGHFENLGVYELVRRRVKYIITCDADADPQYTFGDLANAVEKCRVDFGVQIRFADYAGIAPDPKTGWSNTHYAVGLIEYPAASTTLPEMTGAILYVKSSLTGNEPAQVLGQRAADTAFPHDTTLNQFYNETQFEAYRALGEHLGEGICREFHSRTDALNLRSSPERLERFFEDLIQETRKQMR